MTTISHCVFLYAKCNEYFLAHLTYLFYFLPLCAYAWSQPLFSHVSAYSLSALCGGELSQRLSSQFQFTYQEVTFLFDEGHSAVLGPATQIQPRTNKDTLPLVAAAKTFKMA